MSDASAPSAPPSAPAPSSAPAHTEVAPEQTIVTGAAAATAAAAAATAPLAPILADAVEIEENLTVAVRMRPMDRREREEKEAVGWNITEVGPHCFTLTQVYPEKEKEKRAKPQEFSNLRHVFGPERRTVDVYTSVVKGVVDSCLRGVNGTVMAYGQTASGKTFTMCGSEEEPGIMILAARDIFRACVEKKDAYRTYVRVSYVEVYNNQLRDLLVERAADAKNDGELELRLNKAAGLFEIVGAVKRPVTTVEDVLSLLREGEGERAAPLRCRPGACH
jgi:hypothetical protein